ncbi:MAG: hypothetical protein V4628_13960 [Pseudomonadota bacterium]
MPGQFYRLVIPAPNFHLVVPTIQPDVCTTAGNSRAAQNNDNKFIIGAHS